MNAKFKSIALHVKASEQQKFIGGQAQGKHFLYLISAQDAW